MKISITRSRLFSLLSVFLILSAWKILSISLGSAVLLPPPEIVVRDLFLILIDAEFIITVSYTFFRYLTGFLLALAASLVLGILSGLSDYFYAMIRPLLVIFRSIPVISFILLSLIWFTNSSVPVFISFITMFPIICMNIIDGIRQIDRRYFELASVFRIGRIQQLKDVIIPAIAPFLFSGIATATGFGWRAVIIGEVLSQPEFGIGTRMQVAHIYLLISPLIAWTVVAILISYVLDIMLRKLENHIFKWKINDPGQ
jgi:NitT/TauT family transport system permease protein